MSFLRTFGEISSGDGSLGRVLQDSMQNSVTGSIPSNLLPKRPAANFIPNRQTSDVARAHHDLLVRSNNSSNGGGVSTDSRDESSPGQPTADIAALTESQAASDENSYRRAVISSLTGSDAVAAASTSSAAASGEAGGDGSRILRFKSTARQALPHLVTGQAAHAGLGPGSPRLQQNVHAPNRRFIPRKPQKVLDCPYIVDDFYLSNMSWSSENLLAVALNNEVYLWNAASGSIQHLLSTGLDNEYVSSLAWSPDFPSVLAVGSSAGRVQLWNTAAQALLRTMTVPDAGRIPAVAWRDHVLTSGARVGLIGQHDTRVAHHLVASLQFHDQEVCGLSWSPDKAYLAAGSNDNRVSIWSGSGSAFATSYAAPDTVLTQHRAAVKALAWCPWKPRLLASGGGSADQTMRFWNAANGNCIKAVNVGAQVSGIIWNTEYREVISAHGDPRNQLVIWKYPEISIVAELSEHKSRILDLVSSPCGEIVASSSADETLCLWHCFKVDPNQKKAKQQTDVDKQPAQGSRYPRTIR